MAIVLLTSQSFSGNIGSTVTKFGKPQPSENWNNTVVYYFSNDFVGNAVIQGTLVGAPEEQDWFDIEDTFHEFGMSNNSPVPVNFNGRFSFIRAKVEFTAGTIEKILLGR